MRSKQKRSRDREARKVSREEEIDSLIQRARDEAPTRGSIPRTDQRVAFRALPISEVTLRGLEESKAKFTTMTDIQHACIPHALAGRDVMGAARTGSGKTLAFLIPALECLYRNRFAPMDGLGVIVMSPTRELAVQIFQVLRVAGKYHTFSVGLLIGGQKDFFAEQQQVGRTNIIIATPGRLLQHLEQTPNFETSELRMLILDEADRILDMGFRQQLVRILEYLPKEQRQTLLFSATQTRDIGNLATLSMSRPEYLGVHDKEKSATPESLQQSYIVVPLEHKLDAVYSFVKSHLRSKSIIFFATCAQVRYAWELFCSLRPGVPVMALHGKLVQAKRTEIYFDYIQRPHAVLFATDIAARGLDFKDVDWVVQVDAPEDKDMYIHRAGRTARYRSGGNSLLMITPGEEANKIVDLIEGKGRKIELKKLSINPTKTVVVTERTSSAVAANVKLNRLAKKACESYIRSIHLMPNKEVFNVDDLELDGFAKSLGLASTPNLRFLKNAAKDRQELRSTKNVNRKLQKLKEQIKREKLQRKLERMGKVMPVLAKEAPAENDSSSEDDILVPKRHQKSIETQPVDDTKVGNNAAMETTSRRRKRIHVDSSIQSNNHIVFGQDGQEESRALIQEASEGKVRSNQDLVEASNDYMETVKERMLRNVKQDAQDEKERVRSKHKKRRLQKRGERDSTESGAMLVADVCEADDGSVSTCSESSVDDKRSDIRDQEEAALLLIRGS